MFPLFTLLEEGDRDMKPSTRSLRACVLAVGIYLFGGVQPAVPDPDDPPGPTVIEVGGPTDSLSLGYHNGLGGCLVMAGGCAENRSLRLDPAKAGNTSEGARECNHVS